MKTILLILLAVLIASPALAARKDRPAMTQGMSITHDALDIQEKASRNRYRNNQRMYRTLERGQYQHEQAQRNKARSKRRKQENQRLNW